MKHQLTQPLASSKKKKTSRLNATFIIVGFTKVHARLINGARVKIDVTGDGDRSVAVGALYSSGAHITSAGDVGVSSCHGRIAVHTADAAGSVNLSSVNGIALVSTGAGNDCQVFFSSRLCYDCCDFRYVLSRYHDV